jgi:hypothetical protein
MKTKLLLAGLLNISAGAAFPAKPAAAPAGTNSR